MLKPFTAVTTLAIVFGTSVAAIAAPPQWRYMGKSQITGEALYTDIAAGNREVDIKGRTVTFNYKIGHDVVRAKLNCTKGEAQILTVNGKKSSQVIKAKSGSAHLNRMFGTACAETY